MAASQIRVLAVSDSHLGFDHPVRPRVERRRRGPEFLANLERALAPALRGEVDLVVHAGDVFHRSRPPLPVVIAGMACFHRVAERGVPVFLVPGNHERSRLPAPLLQLHPLLHVFDGPRTFVAVVRGRRVALAGFPFARDVAGRAFDDRLEATGWRRAPADLRLLCVHQAFRGARVGLHDYCFRRGRDVIDGLQVPGEFAAVICGHIHRHQLLERDLSGRRLPAPVVMPGSVERTSFQEQREAKGYVVLDFRPDARGGRLERTRFVRLPARTMAVRRVGVEGVSPDELDQRLGDLLTTLPADAVVRIEPLGVPMPEALPRLSAANLRRLAPRTMNVELPFRMPERARAAR